MRGCIVFNPKDETFYMFYNAVPGKKGVITGGRGIGLITSKTLRAAPKREGKS